MRTRTIEDALLGELREAVTSHYGHRLACIVLFGSRARGEACPDSDYDVLVVLRMGMSIPDVNGAR